MRLFFSGAVVLGLLALPVAGHADPITYTESAVASGSLGGVSFTDALVTLTGVGDTSTAYSSPFYAPDKDNDLTSAEVTVEGLGTFAFTIPVGVVSNQADGFGGLFVDLPFLSPVILGTDSSAFSTYDLTTAIGPLTGSQVTNGGTPFDTEGGSLIFGTVGDSTFMATLDTAATPEPSGLVLLGTGLLGMAGFARRRLLALR